MCDVNLREFPSCKLDPILLVWLNHTFENKIKYWNQGPLGKLIKREKEKLLDLNAMLKMNTHPH